MRETLNVSMCSNNTKNYNKIYIYIFIRKNVSCVPCHVSCVTCHLSPVTWPPLYAASAAIQVSDSLVMRPWGVRWLIELKVLIRSNFTKNLFFYKSPCLSNKKVYRRDKQTEIATDGLNRPRGQFSKDKNSLCSIGWNCKTWRNLYIINIC